MLSYPITVMGITFDNAAQLDHEIREQEYIINNPHGFHHAEILAAAQVLPVLRSALEG